MSAVTQWECDRCGRLGAKPLTDSTMPQGWFKLHQFSPLARPELALAPEFIYDICGRCIADFQKWRKPA